MQIILGTLLAAAFLLFQVLASPYAAMPNGFLASMASFFLAVFFLAATAFKYNVLTGLPDIQAKMSDEQKSLCWLMPELFGLQSPSISLQIALRSHTAHRMLLNLT